eukprot:scaffold43090_cov67-Phaeocystis_antarctica.AAC.3
MSPPARPREPRRLPLRHAKLRAHLLRRRTCVGNTARRNWPEPLRRCLPHRRARCCRSASRAAEGPACRASAGRAWRMYGERAGGGAPGAAARLPSCASTDRSCSPMWKASLIWPASSDATREADWPRLAGPRCRPRAPSSGAGEARLLGATLAEILVGLVSSRRASVLAAGEHPNPNLGPSLNPSPNPNPCFPHSCSPAARTEASASSSRSST